MENWDLHPFTVMVTGSYNRNTADVAQLVEQSIRNRQVIGSSPIVGSNFFKNLPTISSPSAAQLLHS